MLPPDYLQGLVSELIKLPVETGWVEFKENKAVPEEIGEYISALSNTAALLGKANGYLIWGVQDLTHSIVGTDFNPDKCKKGNENLENWLRRLLDPQLHISFYEVLMPEKVLTERASVVLLEIPRAMGRPVQFQGVEYIRVGSYTKKLKDHPEIERELWNVFNITPFEEVSALEHIGDEQVLSLLDYPAYFDLLKQPLPEDRSSILSRLAEERMIQRNQAGGWNITNLGALLFAKELHSFKHLSRKAMRVVVYEGKSRIKTQREQIGHKGYASGFSGLIEFVNALLPRNEVIGKALRKEVPMYPDLAVRELVANALIHQDFSVTGSGPMIEIFSDRMEITNPGQPVVDIDRFLDTPPQSRNESLASFMRRVGICEERGSGIDKVVFETEYYQLPAPIFEKIDGFTRVVLFSHRELREMDIADRSRACYLHSCLRYVNRDPMTNASLRDRFGITEKNAAMASRIIRDAITGGLIRPYDPNQSRRLAKYVPFWA